MSDNSASELKHEDNMLTVKDEKSFGTIQSGSTSCPSITVDKMTEKNVAASDKGVTLSKNQLKKQRKREKWNQIKAQKRREEKLKKKKRFAEAREKGCLGPSRKMLKKNCMKDSSCKVCVAVDCTFDDHMSGKDIVHLVQQIQHSYAANRRAENPVQFYVCGVSGKLKERLEGIGDYKGWDIYMKDESYVDVFDKGSVVYLSSESPNVLSELEDGKVYVIGGLVDHNHYKGLCHHLAEEKGVSHAQLPISEYINMKARKVLTINHVFEILLKFTETKDWRVSFDQVLPSRKGFSLKDIEDRSEDHNSKSNVVTTESSCDVEKHEEIESSCNVEKHEKSESGEVTSTSLPDFGDKNSESKESELMLST